MDSTLKFLSLSGGMLIGSLLAACASGSDTNDTAGSGGSGTGTGGSSTTGGSGTTASGGAGSAETLLYSFNSDPDAFEFNNVIGTDPYVNLVAPGTATVSGAPPSLAWASKDYDGAAMPPGSLKVTATFSDWNQQVAVEVKGPVDKLLAPVDLSNKKLRARVFLEKGLSPKMDAPGGVVLYLKTGAGFAWGQAPWRNLDRPGTWITVLFDTAAPDSGSAATFDPSDPRQLGLQISSGGGGTAGPFGDTPLETVVYIDQVTWSN